MSLAKNGIKALFALAASIALALALFPASASAATYSRDNQVLYMKAYYGLADLNDGWYLQADKSGAFDDGTLFLFYAVQNGLMTGFKNDEGRVVSFGPEGMLSRAQAAAILYRAVNTGSVDTTNPSYYAKTNTSNLPDVKTGEYYTAAVNWCVANGVINGKKLDDGSYIFDPEALVTRQELAAMIGRLCLDKMQVPGAGSSSPSFPDNAKIADWATAHAAFCQANGIITGKSSDGTFAPTENATRAQMAKIIAVTMRNAVGPKSSYEIQPTHYADIVIKDHGTITVALDANAAPKSVENFVALAKQGMYDGTTFHRIMEDFMMQGGQYQQSGSYYNVQGITGEFAFNGVYNPITHTRGTISMARSSNPNSASTGFFIVHKTNENNTNSLDGKYAAFGRVVSGIEIVDRVCTEAKPTDNNGSIPSNQRPVITSVTIRNA